MIHRGTDSARGVTIVMEPNAPFPANNRQALLMNSPDPFVLAKALDWLAEGRGVALATVIRTWGSAPQPVGSQLLIDNDGNFLGSVSGGCVEAEIITEAADVIATGEPKSLEYGVEDNTAWSVGLACGGSIRIFVEKVAPGRNLPDLVGAVRARRRVALVTHLATGAQSVASSPTDIQPVLDTIARNAAQLCGADDAVIRRLEANGIRAAAQ